MKENLLRFTSRLALQAGAVLRQYQNRDFNISKKGPIDLVTEADLEVEKLVVSKILERFPDHSVLAEETGMQQLHLGNSKFVWIVDPLDGTTNFAHRYPFFCISIALEVDGELELGVVYDPMAMDLFSAQKHNGAHLNGKQISVSPETALSESLLSTGFPTDHQNILGNLRLFQDFMLASRAVRRNGSAALDLCYVAAGRLDGFWELSLHPWDVAAGALIVQEAGGTVSRFDGSLLQLRIPEIVASNEGIHDQMLHTIKNHLANP